MTTMREYYVTHGGVELTVQLSEATAKRLNARPVTPAPSQEKAKAPANKSRAPRNK